MGAPERLLLTLRRQARWRSASDLVEDMVRETFASTVDRPLPEGLGKRELAEVIAERKRTLDCEVSVGDVLWHHHDNKSVSCTYAGDRKWILDDGTEFTSCHKAAVAANARLGGKSRVLLGWRFWGMERREEEAEKVFREMDEDGELEAAEPAEEGNSDWRALETREGN